MRHWQACDYLGGLLLGLIASVAAMALFGHFWYALVLAGCAGLTMLAMVVIFLYVAIRYGDDEMSWDSEADRNLWRKGK